MTQERLKTHSKVSNISQNWKSDHDRYCPKDQRKWFCECFCRLADQQATAVGNGRGRYPWMDPERITGNGCRDGQDIF